MAVNPIHRKHQFLKKSLLFMGGRREKKNTKEDYEIKKDRNKGCKKVGWNS